MSTPRDHACIGNQLPPATAALIEQKGAESLRAQLLLARQQADAFMFAECEVAAMTGADEGGSDAARGTAGIALRVDSDILRTLSASYRSRPSRYSLPMDLTQAPQDLIEPYILGCRLWKPKCTGSFYSRLEHRSGGSRPPGPSPKRRRRWRSAASSASLPAEQTHRQGR